MAQSQAIAMPAKTAAHQGARTGFILFAMCLGVFIAQLDSSVVYLAVSNIGKDLNAGITEQQWILDIYNLIYAALLLTGGTLADLYGRARMFVLGVALIAVGSIICAVAPGTEILIFGRGVTGVGAALEIPASLAFSPSPIRTRMRGDAPSATGPHGCDRGRPDHCVSSILHA